MRTLVTGLSGFVGSYCGDQMDAVGLAIDGESVDLRNAAQVLVAVQIARPEAVIHLAAQSSVAASFANPLETYEINFIGTLNLLLALRRLRYRGRFLYVGSGDTYGRVGESELPVSEDRPMRPRNPYSVSKLAAEALCYQWSQSENIEILMARPFNHIGPRQDTRFVVADIARQVIQIKNRKSKPELQVGDIEATRDFTDVRDVVRAYALLLRHGRTGEIYNVCSGLERSVRQIIEMLCTAEGISPNIHVVKDRLRPIEQRRMRGSYAKLESHCGWRPLISIERSLTDILDYWNKQDQE